MGRMWLNAYSKTLISEILTIRYPQNLNMTKNNTTNPKQNKKILNFLKSTMLINKIQF